MCIHARFYYILAGFKMVCEFPDDGMVIWQTSTSNERMYKHKII